MINKCLLLPLNLYQRSKNMNKIMSIVISIVKAEGDVKYRITEDLFEGVTSYWRPNGKQ
jgi:hypothetical protein